MNRFSFSHHEDHVLLRDLASDVAKDCDVTACLLARLAEVDARRLFLPEAHSSMHSYCVHVLGLSEDSANKRIRVARKTRECPALLEAIADGRLHLSGAALLASRLTPDNADELLAAAARKTRAEIEVLLAQRFPRKDAPARVAPVPPPPPSLLSDSDSADQLAPGPVEVPRPKVTPLAPERYSVQFTLGQEAYETLRYAQALMGHQVPAGDVAAVLDRALHALVTALEKTRFAATSRPRGKRGRASSDPRNVPAHVKRAVWERDGGQCGFVSGSGGRCPERSRLEFDHVLEVARGGEATVEGMRLRCRAHNQFEAECTFGAGFMERKREEARRAAAERKMAAARTETRSVPKEQVLQAPAPENSTVPSPWTPSASESVHVPQDLEQEQDLLRCLKGLGVRADQARMAVEHSRVLHDASMEQRLHVALKFIGSRGRTYSLQQAVMSRAS